MFGLFLTHKSCGMFAAASQVWWTPSHVMGITRHDVDAALAQHSFGPVLCSTPEITGKRASGDLHPDAGAKQPRDRRVLLLDPRQTLGMRQDRHVTCHQQAKEDVLKVHRCDMVRRLHQDVT